MHAVAVVTGEARCAAMASRFAGIAQAAAWTVLGLLAAGGLLVCMRRAGGALAEPLPALVMAALGLALAGVALGFRRLTAFDRRPRAVAYLAWFGPTAVLVLWAAGVSLRTTSPFGLAALLVPLLLEEGFSWGRFRSPAARVERRPAPSPAVATSPDVGSVLVDGPSSPALDEADPSITQQITRRLDEASDVMEGLVRIDFVEGQRHGVAHVAICPPMEQAPACFAEQADGPPAAVKVAEVQSYGVRFEVKLDEPAPEPASVLVEFSMRTDGSES